MGHRIVSTLTDPESGEVVYQDETGARYDSAGWELDAAGEWVTLPPEPEPEPEPARARRPKGTADA